MRFLTFAQAIKSPLWRLLPLLSLAACQQLPPPLDPLIGDTGQPLSEIAQRADVKTYDLSLEIFPDKKAIKGSGRTEFLLLEDSAQVELKLDSRFDIEQIRVNDQAAQFQRQGGILTIELGKTFHPGERVTVDVYYSGKPHIALNAPWTGGTVWKQTDNGQPWIATAVQGEGCDLFWPCKDHFTDKADSMRIRLTVPKGLSAVTNGVLQGITPVGEDKTQFDWLLSVPASDYNIALNIGPYRRIQQTYTSINGAQVPIEFWALDENAEKAQQLIDNDLLQQIEFFERQLGPYPWGDQKLGFVETPHLGMEHQTINAYGKKYKRDDYGFDWLLQHELAHEWFGNLITHEKLNDAWLHEGFGLYMQPAYSLDHFGSAAYNHSMYKSYLGLMNCKPIVLEGDITSEQAFNSDIYGKGGWTLHTLRWLIGDKLFWQATRELLYGTDNTTSLTYPITPRYRNTQDFIGIVNKLTGEDYQWLFDMYLKQAELPELVQQTQRQEQGQEQGQGQSITLSWKTPDELPFPMPVPVSVNGQLQVYQPVDGTITIAASADDHVVIDPEMKVLRYLPIIGLCDENTEKRKKR
ncbi:M1 family metallopeptidase [Microbulbifer sp. CAU 1566]|uniref:M1 family metallopeptidase n=1 Tax=Microbulbifer sp. CAU 1566 TaxID=2933269 RepID=UPI002002D050|nr:M1 family metallopeptidase [Microbulbifer sp. CAU 1566]MCK7596217.1 M1 family metallopeptidase [Microbulbifer sp. CAU 1566]